MTLLEISGLESGYGDLMVINGADMAVETDEMVSIIGPNGAGKSTLLKSIVGLTTIKSGSIRLNGEDITGVPPEDVIYHGICHVPQVDNIFPKLTVLENLKMARGPWAKPASRSRTASRRCTSGFQCWRNAPTSELARSAAGNSRWSRWVPR